MEIKYLNTIFLPTSPGRILGYTNTTCPYGWILIFIDSSLVLYSFCANFLHLIMWLIVSITTWPTFTILLSLLSFYSLWVFYTRVSSWTFDGVWVTTSLLRLLKTLLTIRVVPKNAVFLWCKFLPFIFPSLWGLF